MKKYIILTVVSILLTSTLVTAQMQLGQGINDFNQKAPELHNLALLPNHSVPSLMVTAGSRMDGFGRHPFTGTLLCSGYLIDRLGGGLKVNYDKAGLSTKIDAQIGLTYYIFLTKDRSDDAGDNIKGDKCSFFLAGHFTQDRIRQEDIIATNSNDPNLLNVSEMAPGGNASAGVAFLREDKYYAGLSVYQLIEHKTDFMNDAWKNRQKRQYFLCGAYTFNLCRKTPLDLELNAIATLNSFNAYQFVAGADLTIIKILSAGVAYRSNGSLRFNLGVKAQSWDFGYACSYGAFVDASAYSYKGFSNAVFIRKIFNEGRRSVQ
jgi:type IX secretion system PorP/SprF family membrane protein